MPTTTADFTIVRKIGASLPDVEEGTAYGSPALKVRGKMFACLAINRSTESNTLMVCLDFEQRDQLIAEAPKIYYLTDHYVNHPCVLVRLSRIRKDALHDLLMTGHRFVSASKPREVPRRRRK